MQLRHDSDYVTYDLNQHEEIESHILTHLQIATIQNWKMEVMERKVNLKTEDMKPESRDSYWQQEAYLRGQLDVLNHLLTASKEAQKYFSNQPDQSDNQE